MGNFLPGRTSVRDQIREEMALVSKEGICAEMKELKYLRSRNALLESQLRELKEQVRANSQGQNLSMTAIPDNELKQLSEARIDECIAQMLSNPDINISWLPDVVERKLYKNIAMVALNIIESTLENSHVEFMGHRLRFVVDPTLEQVPAQTDA